jgi:trehalose 2-sulfotransferase
MSTNKSYFICFSVRSGSSLLCQLLVDTQLAGKPQEHFYHGISPDNPKGDEIPDYQSFITQTLMENTTPNGVFGTKIGGGVWHDFVPRIQSIEGMANKPLDVALKELFPNLRYIWLTRRNKVRQAVSHWMAIQSGRWHSPDAISNPLPEYNYDAIDYLLQEIVIREAVWADYFSQYHITPHVIVYEDYIQDLEGTTRNILDFLDIEIPAKFHVPLPQFRKTANDLTEDWVQRYRNEKQQDWWAKFW